MGRETCELNSEFSSSDLDGAKNEILSYNLDSQMTNKAVGIEPEVIGRYNKESDDILRSDQEVQEAVKEKVGEQAFLFYKTVIEQYLDSKYKKYPDSKDKKELEQVIESFKAGLKNEQCDFSNLIVPEKVDEPAFAKAEAQLQGQLIEALKEAILTDDIKLKWDILKILQQQAILEVMRNPKDEVKNLFTVKKGIDARSQEKLTAVFVDAWKKGDSAETFDRIAALHTVNFGRQNIDIRQTSYFQDKKRLLDANLQKVISQTFPLFLEAGKSLSAVRDLDAPYRVNEFSRRHSVLTSLQDWLNKNVTYNDDRKKVDALALSPQPSPIKELMNAKLGKIEKGQQEQEKSLQEKQKLYDEKYNENLAKLAKEKNAIEKAIFDTKKKKGRRLNLLNDKWESELKKLENVKEGGIGIAPFKTDSTPLNQTEQYARRDALYQAREEIKELLPQAQTEEYF